jgi:hypothetical protein
MNPHRDSAGLSRLGKDNAQLMPFRDYGIRVEPTGGRTKGVDHMYSDLIFFVITTYVVLMFGFIVADVIVGGHKGR